MSDQENPGGAAGEAADPDPGPETTEADAAEAAAEPSGPGWIREALTGNVIIQAITEGSPVVVTILAMFAALVIGGILIVVSDPVVLHAWDSFSYAPGSAFSATWNSVAAAYSAMFEGAIFSPSGAPAAVLNASKSAKDCF